MTSWAALPTASIAHAANTNTVVLPNKPAMNISGFVISMLSILTGDNKLISSIKAEKRRKQAREAEPTE
jgi:hypothetical protein